MNSASEGIRLGFSYLDGGCFCGGLQINGTSDFGWWLQALAVGSGSSGSGVVTLLELARLFSRLYANPNTRGPYNLLFGLTSGGPYNYNGTHNVSLLLYSSGLLYLILRVIGPCMYINSYVRLFSP